MRLWEVMERHTVEGHHAIVHNRRHVAPRDSRGVDVRRTEQQNINHTWVERADNSDL